MPEGTQAITDDGGVLRHPDGVARCWWCGEDPGYVAYHDDEWGRPVHDEQRLFEKLCLEGFQAGLSWLTVLRRREALRRAFEGFDPVRVATFDERDIARLIGDARIIRHRAKIEAVVTNARALLALHRGGASLAQMVWHHAPPPRPRPRTPGEIPTSTPSSHALAAELKASGFAFVGARTMYALMQSMGIVDDHLADCHRAAHPPA